MRGLANLPRKLPPSNPIRAHKRRATAERRVGVDAQCACGEKRPESLIPRSNPIICAECKRKSRRQTTLDKHHVAGEANSPVTMAVPTNDHRARLSVDQYDWPRKTLENSDGSPLLAGAACIRGFADCILYLIEELLLWIAEMLESLDAIQVQKSGPNWWHKTELERFKPKR